MIQPYVMFYNTYQSAIIGVEQTALIQYESRVNWYQNRYVVAINWHKLVSRIVHELDAAVHE